MEDACRDITGDYIASTRSDLHDMVCLTEQVVTEMTEMTSSIQEVPRNASKAADSANEVDDLTAPARKGLYYRQRIGERLQCYQTDS